MSGAALAEGGDEPWCCECGFTVRLVPPGYIRSNNALCSPTMLLLLLLLLLTLE